MQITSRPSSGRVLEDGPRVREVPQHLADEEGIPVGLAVDRVRQLHPGPRKGLARSRLEILDDLAVVEPLQGEPVHSGLAAKGAQGDRQRVAGRELVVPIRPDHEQPQRLPFPHQMAKQLQAGSVGPLQIVQHEHHGRYLRGRAQQGGHGPVEQVTLGLAVDLPERRQLAQPRSQGPRDPHGVGPLRGHVCLEHLLRGVGDVVAERFGKRCVGDAEVLVAPAKEHDGTCVVRTARRLGREGGLPLTRFPADEQDLASRSRGDALERFGECGQLVATTDDAGAWPPGQTAGKRDAIGSLDLGLDGLPRHLEGRHGVGDTLELQLAERSQRHGTPAAGHDLDDLRRQDLPALGPGAQASGLHYRVPEIVLPLPRDLPAADADPHPEVSAILAVLRLDPLLHGDGTGEGGRGCGEGNHETVAQVLDLGTAGLGYGLAENVKVVPAHLVRHLRRERLREGGGADQVGKEDGRALLHQSAREDTRRASSRLVLEIAHGQRMPRGETGP